MIVCLPHEANFLYFCKMKITLLHRLFLIALFAALMPFAALAGNSNNARFKLSDPVFAIDSVPSKKPDNKPENKPSDKPEIKEVPKSRRQIKPSAVGEKIRVKPPVRVKPNIIRKPAGNIKRALGKLG